MKKFLTVALAGVLAASMLFTGCSKKEESKVPDKLIVGTNAEFPPFEYMNDKKQPDGFDIAMIKEIGKRMDKKVEIQNMEFKSLIGAMESNSINTIIAGMTKTKERQKSVDFSDSYYTSNQAIILKKDSKIKTTYLYFKVAQQNGTTGQRVERAIRHAFDIVRSCRGDYDVVNHYIGFINCANSPSLSMLTMKIREEALEVQEPKPEKKEENVITGITEARLLELMRQAYTEFWADMIIRLKK